MPDGPRMVSLGFGKFARADRIYALRDGRIVSPPPAPSGPAPVGAVSPGER